MSRRKLYVVSLTDEERSKLVSLTRSGKTNASSITRAKILLKADQSEGGPAWKDKPIAEALDVNICTVGNVRRHFCERGLDRTVNRQDGPIPRRKPKLDAKGEATLMAIACQDPPDGRKRWTLELLGDELVRLRVVDSISYEAVRKYLKKGASHLT